MTGFLYRRAVNMKELGERLGWGWLIKLGLGLRGWVMKHGTI